jgi:hypothetical protein
MTLTISNFNLTRGHIHKVKKKQVGSIDGC